MRTTHLPTPATGRSSDTPGDQSSSRTSTLIPLLAAFEASVGVLILVRRTRRIGIACAIGFSVALMLFGFGIWAWSLPVIALLAYFWRLESLGGVRHEPIGADP